MIDNLVNSPLSKIVDSGTRNAPCSLVCNHIQGKRENLATLIGTDTYCNHDALTAISSGDNKSRRVGVKSIPYYGKSARIIPAAMAGFQRNDTLQHL